jgi:hypothetical protein
MWPCGAGDGLARRRDSRLVQVEIRICLRTLCRLRASTRDSMWMVAILLFSTQHRIDIPCRREQQHQRRKRQRRRRQQQVHAHGSLERDGEIETETEREKGKGRRKHESHDSRDVRRAAPALSWLVEDRSQRVCACVCVCVCVRMCVCVCVCAGEGLWTSGCAYRHEWRKRGETHHVESVMTSAPSRRGEAAGRLVRSVRRSRDHAGREGGWLVGGS